MYQTNIQVLRLSARNAWYSITKTGFLKPSISCAYEPIVRNFVREAWEGRLLNRITDISRHSRHFFFCETKDVWVFFKVKKCFRKADLLVTRKIVNIFRKARLMSWIQSLHSKSWHECWFKSSTIIHKVWLVVLRIQPQSVVSDYFYVPDWTIGEFDTQV